MQEVYAERARGNPQVPTRNSPAVDHPDKPEGSIEDGHVGMKRKRRDRGVDEPVKPSRSNTSRPQKIATTSKSRDKRVVEVGRQNHPVGEMSEGKRYHLIVSLE